MLLSPRAEEPEPAEELDEEPEEPQGDGNEDDGGAKTENCGAGVKWHVQNTANMQASKEKLAQGRWWRNVTQCPTPQTALPALGDITGLRSVTLMAAGRPPTATAPSSSGRTPPQPPNPPAQAMPMPKPMPRDLPAA